MNYTMDTTGTAMENLYPALTECFAIIICGYFAGRMNLISDTEAKGLSTFVGTFSLPSLIFMSLAELDLSSVNWMFLVSILVAKSIVFFSVIIITLLVGRPINLGRAGIFAIFCTQSNDFAIGYPIVVALYKNTHPDYPSYLYLMAPISLAILNPIAFVLLEIGKRKEHNEQNGMLINDFSDSSSGSIRKEKLKLIGQVAKGIILNPIILMTLLGIIGNLIFKHHIPTYLGGILQVLGSAFSATALFLLGLRMVGKIHTLRGATLVVPGILILVKLLALPLVTREVVSLINAGGSVNETLDLSTYGFLYGTFPAAPTVFVFATQYNLDVDLIASAMVACTFLSAPLMFVSAKMITLTKLKPCDYIVELDNFAFDISVAGMVACIWVIITFIITKKIKRIPHKLTTYLVVSQFLSCLGVVLWSALGQRQDWVAYLQFAIFTIGVYSSRLWTAFLAVGLLFMQCRSLCFVLKLEKLFLVLGWGLPILIATFLMVFDKQNVMPYDKRNLNFQYGIAQALIAVCLLILCFVVTVGCLILHQRYRKRYAQYLNMARDVAINRPPSSINSESDLSDTDSIHSNSDRLLPENAVNAVNKNNHKCGSLPTINEGCCEEVQSPVIDIEDLMGPSNAATNILRGVTPQPIDVLHPTPGGLCPTRFGCQGPARDQCQGILQQYQDQQTGDSDVETLEEDMDSHDPQTFRHIVLLILLLCSMFVGLAISIWTLVMEEMSGIYIELAFLDSTLNFGQSLIVFVIFGVDTKEILLPILKYWRKIWYGANFLVLPAWDELNAETKHICDQFVTHHLANCRRAIAKDTRWRIKIYKNVFSGTKFVDWLLEVGLARDRIEAVNYSRHLIEGKVLKHINNVHHFYDRNLLYTFV